LVHFSRVAAVFSNEVGAGEDVGLGCGGKAGDDGLFVGARGGRAEAEAQRIERRVLGDDPVVGDDQLENKAALVTTGVPAARALADALMASPIRNPAHRQARTVRFITIIPVFSKHQCRRCQRPAGAAIRV